jgi:glyoxylase-like metal-dependent hydrolase (beta-lactamase superfamily II)
MAWDSYVANVDVRTAQVLLDRSFASAPPASQLPRLAWFGVWARLPAGGAFWDPAEAAALDDIEVALLDLAGQVARGWGVYVRRLATAGLREYYFYTGAHFDLASVAAELVERFPQYRVEHAHTADPDWAKYTGWVAEKSLPGHAV